MKELLTKALINFGMIQIPLAITSASLARNVPATNNFIVTFLFVYMVIFLVSFIPTVATSLAFAYFRK